MKSTMPGKDTFPIEINITRFGLWLYLQDKEFFLSYKDYPFFKEATVNHIFDVEIHHKTHLHWPSLDADLSIEILENPDKFPLVDQ